MVNYVYVKTVLDSTNLRSIKSTFSGGACPQTPLVCRMLCMQICTCPPVIHTISFCLPLGNKLKETLTHLPNVSTDLCTTILSHGHYHETTTHIPKMLSFLAE